MDLTMVVSVTLYLYAFKNYHEKTENNRSQLKKIIFWISLSTNYNVFGKGS